ncbi:MAG TPA: YHS domain-containing (seleno)protein [Terriglobales bacterium]|nr:YHS domain-containing (seleno)protein [Terriglobales bacterium]
MKRLLLLILFVAVSTYSFAAMKTLVNVDKTGLGLKGYDPVAYFTENKPVMGNPQFVSTYNGARYQFASAANKSAFEAMPSKYEPQFGGFCAYAASEGHTAKIEPDAFEVLNGRLLLQYDRDVREMFNKDPQGRLKKADANWPGLVDKNGK